MKNSCSIPPDIIKRNWAFVLIPFYGVDKVTILEPIDSGIVSQKTLPNNIYQRIVYIMKQSTQEYYNMRIVLGLECK